MKKKSNVKQFRRGSVPQEPVDSDNRVGNKEPSSPSKERKRSGVKLGAQVEARPGLVGLSDYPRDKKRGR